MPRDSSGIFARGAPPYVGGTTILAANVNSEMDDIATELSASLPRNGSAPMTGNLNMAGKRIRALAAPIDADDAASKAYADSRVAPVSGEYLNAAGFDMTALNTFLFLAIPDKTRSILLTGHIRGFVLGGTVGVAPSAVLRNAGDTANEAEYGFIGYGVGEPGRHLVLPISFAVDFGAPLAGGRALRLQAATDGPVFRVYSYRAALFAAKG